MRPTATSIFADIPAHLPEEQLLALCGHSHLKIERIVSKGHVTASEQWYDQAWDEWVLLLQGQAILVFADDPEPLQLMPGDYVLIPAHCRHRVSWTLPDAHSIWLAIHYPAAVTAAESP